MRRSAIALLCLSVPVAMPGLAGAQDAAGGADGEVLFRQVCGQCHSVEQGENRLGPHLHDVIGREAGSVEDFRYSRAMAEADITWTEEEIDAFITAPMQYLPGTRMAFTGVRDAEDRETIIAHLRAHSETDGDGADAGPDAGGAAEPEVGADTGQREPAGGIGGGTMNPGGMVTGETGGTGGGDDAGSGTGGASDPGGDASDPGGGAETGGAVAPQPEGGGSAGPDQTGETVDEEDDA